MYMDTSYCSSTGSFQSRFSVLSANYQHDSEHEVFWLPCLLDPRSIICFKRCPYLRSYITDITKSIRSSGIVSNEWRKSCTLLAHKKGDKMEPVKSHPIKLASVSLKIFTSPLSNFIFVLLCSNKFIEHETQKGFIPKLSGTLELTSLMAHIIKRARYRQRSLVITLLDLKNAFGEAHHNFIRELLRYHHVPNHIQQLNSALYTDSRTFIITHDCNTSVLPVRRRVL